MEALKTFYDFNVSSQYERRERNNLFPELAKFHLALREELGEEEYLNFYESEKNCFKQLAAQSQAFTQT